MSSDNDDVKYEIIDPAISDHESTMVDNVIYSGMNRKERKMQESNYEKFMQWSKTLGSQFNQDGVRSETHNFQYSQKTVDYDSKGRPKKPQQQQQEQSQSDSNTDDILARMKTHASGSNDPVEQRFYEAKKRAGLI